MIPLFKVYSSPDICKNLQEVFDSGFTGQGGKVGRFELELEKVFNNPNIVTVNSGTSALQLAIHLLNPPGVPFDTEDEIITTPLGCFASVCAILNNNVKIKWADVDPNTCNIDLIDVKRKLTKNTRAILVVHWGGYPVDLNFLRQIQKDYLDEFHKELPVIEDCAHCWDTKYYQKLIGNSGNYCCFSFQSIKFLTTADGGMLITPNGYITKRAKLLRWFGVDRESGNSFRCLNNINESGFKYQMNNIAATIGLCNLQRVDTLVNTHRENAQYYKEHLSKFDGITLLREDPAINASYWLFTIKVDDRSNFIEMMNKKGIMTNPVHARCDKHSSVQWFKSFLPGMDFLQDRYVAIPVGWWISPEDRSYIVKTIKEGW